MKIFFIIAFCLIPLLTYANYKEYGCKAEDGFTCKIKVEAEYSQHIHLNYILNIKTPLFRIERYGSDYYMEFLDADGFLIEKEAIGHFTPQYTGTTRGYVMIKKSTWEKTKNISISAIQSQS